MRCPSCGFENLPGLERCAVCSTSLAVRTSRESVLPPRAGKRPAWQKLNWALEHSPAWTRVGAVLQTLGPALAGAALTLISTIPGAAHLLAIRGQRKTGLIMLPAAILLACLAAALYRSHISNLLGWGLLGLSMYSMWATVRYLRGIPENPARRHLRDTGLALMVFAAYLGTYTWMTLLLTPIARIVEFNGIRGEGITAGDRLLVTRRSEYAKGDLAVGRTIGGDSVVGRLVGAPGDRVEISDGIYVNGRRLNFEYLRLTGLSFDGSARTLVLTDKQYWILPLSQVRANPDNLSGACIVTREDISGRITAVIGPAPHRRWFR